MRICELNLGRMAEGLDMPDTNDEWLRCIAALGFNHVLLSGWPAEVLGDPDAPAVLTALCAACRRNQLTPLLDVSLDRCPAHVAGMDACWIDDAAPTSGPDETDFHLPGARLRWREPGIGEALAEWWVQQLGIAARAGAAGFCLRAPGRVPGRHWARVTAALRNGNGDSTDGTRPLSLLAWTPGLSAASLEDLAQGDFDGAFCSLPWWDYHSAWLTEEMARLRRFGRVLAAPSLTPTGCDALSARRALWTAAAIGDGVLIPAGFEIGGSRRDLPAYDITDDLLEANVWLEARGNTAAASVRLLSGPGAALTAVARLPPPADGHEGAIAASRNAVVAVINPSPTETGTLDADRVLGGLPCPSARLEPSVGGPGDGFDANEAFDALGSIMLAPAEIRLYRPVPAPTGSHAARTPTEGAPVSTTGLGSIVAALEAPRIAIEHVEPTCDGGRFAVRRVVGERVEVSADIWMDGHDKLAAAVLWRALDEQDWHEAPMRHRLNDRWYGSFPLVALGRHEFTVEAWRDGFASWRDEIGKKLAAGVNVKLEIEEGARLVADALLGTDRNGAKPNDELDAIVEELATSAGHDEQRLEILLAPRTDAAMTAAMRTPAGRPFLTRHLVSFPVEAERLAARFASWYELFPRSESGDPHRHGTFADVIARLPAIRAMGFDVLYFTPIHPIGRTHRKGRNNSLVAEHNDPGSPYAIGAEEGGHDALHPELGTFEEFHQLRDAAEAAGLELALDFAIQCSPDHPWLKAHPEWFLWRPDGTLRYAENPPKKYEDIVNVDFYAAPPAAAALWQALRDVVMFWAEHGVRIFRVDNPHTKPLPFWEWMIADVRARYPDVIFLSEAFTRPKMMARLAKLGFSQSYTYFTWRNTKEEFTQYMTELTQAPLRDIFRPHFFVNTPDINPYFLHKGGRPAFLIRAVLATMLSGLWGMYSGFELCESAPLVLGDKVREEYLDSEKYQLRPRNWQRSGNIVAEITRLNQIRLNHPALQSHLGLRFYHAGNDAILYFARFVPATDFDDPDFGGFSDDVLLIAVNFDPHNVQEADIEIPLWEWGLPDHAAVSVHDLMQGRHFELTGKHQHIRLDPAQLPFAVWHVTPTGGARRKASHRGDGTPDPHHA